MNNVKNIFILAIVFSVIDVAFIWILKISEIIEKGIVKDLIINSLSIIGVIFLMSVVISLILKLAKK